MWLEVYEQVITALFFFEAIMIALLAIKKSWAAILVSFQTVMLPQLLIFLLNLLQDRLEGNH